MTYLLLMGSAAQAVMEEGGEGKAGASTSDGLIRILAKTDEVQAEPISNTQTRLDFNPSDDNDSVALNLAMFQDPPATEAPPAEHSDLAGQATNPVAPLIQFQLQNSFVGENKAGEGYSNQLVVQPVIPWKIGTHRRCHEDLGGRLRYRLPRTFWTMERVVSSIA